MVDCFSSPPAVGSSSYRGSSSSAWKPNVEISPACPRCGSSNTKFCYYNNYSLTQPRYFCKGCRRYWTKGGSLRNVPIGGGCRKTRRTCNPSSNKPPALPIRGSSSQSSDNNVRRLNDDVAAASSSQGFPTFGRVNNDDQPASNTEGDGPINNSIDLAVVYANFLKPAGHHQRFEIPQFSNLPDHNINIATAAPPPGLHFSNVESVHLDLFASAHHHQQNNCTAGGGGCGGATTTASTSFQDDHQRPSSSSGHGVYHCGGPIIDTVHHHHLFTSTRSNFVLPPLPDDQELLISETMVWPISDVMIPAGGGGHDRDEHDNRHHSPQLLSSSSPLANISNVESSFNISNFEDIFKP